MVSLGLRVSQSIYTSLGAMTRFRCMKHESLIYVETKMTRSSGEFNGRNYTNVPDQSGTQIPALGLASSNLGNAD